MNRPAGPAPTTNTWVSVAIRGPVVLASCADPTQSDDRQRAVLDTPASGCLLSGGHADGRREPVIFPCGLVGPAAVGCVFSPNAYCTALAARAARKSWAMRED